MISTIFPVFLPLLLSATESPLIRERRPARGCPRARTLANLLRRPSVEPARFAKLGDMAETDVSAAPFSGRTAWTRNLQTPLRAYLNTETGSSAILLAAILAALLWANVDHASYERVWTTTLSIRFGGHSISMDLRGWINSGLMTFFFFVIGLEARREFDLGELRERRRVALPLLAGLGGMVVPVLLYLAINAGHSSTHGWGVAMSTDTAFALGLLALVGSGLPARLRAYLLTVAVVDDILALLVIAIAYSGSISVAPLLARVRPVRLHPRSPGRRHPLRTRLLRPRIGGLGRVLRGRRRSGGRGPHGRRDRARVPRRSAPTSSARATSSASSVNSRRASSRGPRGRLCGRRSRRTSGCRRSGIRGRATRSCRSSRWRTPAST